MQEVFGDMPHSHFLSHTSQHQSLIKCTKPSPQLVYEASKYMYMHVTPFFSSLCSDRVSAIVGVDGGVGGWADNPLPLNIDCNE